jgi:poly(3-hydroxybutyrate) depolymerase
VPRGAALVCVLFLLSAGAGAVEIDQLRRFVFEGKPRQFFLFAPHKVCEAGAKPAPVVVLHHGTGGTGREMVAAWRELARKERVILLAPTGTGPYGWIPPQDGPELQRAIVEQVAQECAVDRRRLYVAGFSNGGDHAFFVAIAESRYFAAAAVLCASLRPRQFAMLDLAPRKVPLFYMVAERDAAYPLPEASATRAALEKRKWPLDYRLLREQGHGYEPSFTTEAWDFLRKQRLAAEPEFDPVTEKWLSFALR